MQRTRRRAVPTGASALALSAGAVLLTLPARSDAQGSGAVINVRDASQRPRLLEQAQAAAAEGSAARAYELALQASALQQTPSVSLFLARQAQSLRRLQPSLTHAEDCLRMLGRDETVRFREQLTAQCIELSHATRAQAGFVLLRIPASASLRLRVDGTDVPASLYGLPYAVEPGEVRVELSEDGRARERVLRVARGESVTVTAASFRNDAVTAIDDSTLIDAPGRPRRPRAEGGPGAGPWVLVGVGAAGAVTGAVLWGLAGAARGGCVTEAGVGLCDTPADVDRAQSAPGFALGGNIAVPVGLAAAAGGVLWYVLARPSAPRTNAGVSHGGCMPGGVGVVCAF